MQEYVEYFNGETNNFILADSKNWDIQRLIRNAQMLLTDYSSVYFDFVYQEKPVISYQFDLDKFHQNHYSPGYLPYDNNPFFKSSVDEKAVIDELSNYLSNECQVSDRYVATANKFFPIKDQQNRQCKPVKKKQWLQENWGCWDRFDQPGTIGWNWNRSSPCPSWNGSILTGSLTIKRPCGWTTDFGTPVS